jgi:alanyl-tRNA synthetase
MSTPRLYYDDSLLLAFDARVVAHGVWSGAASAILDRTAFYPEAGGQMADRGLLGGVAVIDVQADDAGVVHHVLGGALPAIGAEVHGEIDRARRRVHMALHTGQHMLSRGLLDVAGGETVSARLGETACTIDLDLEKANDGALARAEELVNAVIDDDVPIRAWFPEPTELAGLPLRKEPKVSDHVRVVEVKGFDVSPCGGTHCLSSGQVGLVRITNVERYKGKLRVTFASGRRARDELGRYHEILRGLSRDLTCGPDAVQTALDKLKRDLQETREALGLARSRMADAAAEELVQAARAAGRTQVVAAFDDAEPALLRQVAKRITAEPELVAMLAARGPEGTQVLIGRGAASTFDCGAFLKRVAQAAGGRGGGKPDRAEGRLPPGIDWPALISAQLPE